MIQSVIEIPTIEIIHQKTDDFRRSFPVLHPDGTLFDITNIDPVIIIKEKGEIKLTLENSDWEKTVNSELVVKKAALFFEEFNCLSCYTFRFFDRTSNSTLIKGSFKVT